MFDRDHYRALRDTELLQRAVEDGINPEMSVALADALARQCCAMHLVGSFNFNPKHRKD